MQKIPTQNELTFKTSWDKKIIFYKYNAYQLGD